MFDEFLLNLPGLAFLKLLLSIVVSTCCVWVSFEYSFWRVSIKFISVIFLQNSYCAQSSQPVAYELGLNRMSDEFLLNLSLLPSYKILIEYSRNILLPVSQVFWQVLTEELCSGSNSLAVMSAIPGATAPKWSQDEVMGRPSRDLGWWGGAGGAIAPHIYAPISYQTSVGGL